MAQTNAAATGFDALKRGTWLTRKKLRDYAVILLMIEIAGFLFFAAGTHGLIVPLDRPNASDFVSFYAAGALANAGTPELAYDAMAHHAAEQAATEPGIPYNYFYYPPVFLLLCALLARLPYLVAFAIFEAASFALYFLAARRILGERGALVSLLVFAFPAVFWNAGLGQNAFLTAALFASGMLLIEKRPVLAGLLLGALCYKPHFGLLIPVALAAGRHGRAFGAAAFSVLALVGLSILIFGWETWRDYLAAAFASPAIYGSDRVYTGGFVSPFGAVLALGGGTNLASAVQAAVTLFAVAWAAIVWARDLSLPIRAATLIAATIVSIPVILFYDLMLGAVAMMWLVRSARATGFADWEKTILALLYVLPLLSGHLGNGWQPMMAPLFAALLFALCVSIGRRAIAQSGAMGKMVFPEA
jgi:hypothetical protein